MQPSDFLASIERHQAEVANQPDPTEEFAKQQFQKVVDAVMAANKTLLDYMKSQRTVSIDNLPKFPNTIKTPDIAEVTKAIKGLEKALKPTKQDNSDVVSALKDLASKQVSAADIAKASKAPIVNVPTQPAPVVKVDAPDLTPITKAIEKNKPESLDLTPVIKAMKDVKQAVNDKPVPGSVSVPTAPFIKYNVNHIDDSGTVQYFGYTDTTNSWMVKKYDTSVTPATMQYASGSGNYLTNWGNRASLTYAVWGS